MNNPIEQAHAAARSETILRVADLKVHFPVTEGIIVKKTVGSNKAVDGVTFDVRRGETFGLVGESGSGKSTTALAVLRMQAVTAGKIILDAKDITHLSPSEMRPIRRRMQMVYQDPYSSLNPRMKVSEIIGEPLKIHGIDGTKREFNSKVDELMDLVGLRREMRDRYPHEFSGGQRQRIGIARALALEPDLLICDEAVSALDVSIQAQVINLFMELQERLGLTYLFIAHDLSVVRHISDRIAVMYLGRIVEVATKDELFANPKHPYTKALLAAVPVPNPELEATRPQQIISGEVPSVRNPPKGCTFHPRCPLAQEQCRKTPPQLKAHGEHSAVSCHLLD